MAHGSKNVIVGIFVLLGFLIAIFYYGVLNYSLLISAGFIAVIGIFIIGFIKMEIGLVILIISMLFSPEISLGAILHRSITVRLEDILIPILFLAWLGRIAIKREYRLLVKNPLNVPILLYITVCIISTVRGVTLGSVDPFAGVFFNLKLIEFFLIYFFVVNFIKTTKQVRYFLIFALITVFVIALYGLYQVPKVEIWSPNRITAPFEGNPEPATIGGYLVLLLAISLSLFLYSRGLLQKWVYGSLSLAIIIPLIYTLSRISYLSCLVMLFTLAIFSRKKLLLFSLATFLFLSPIILPQKIQDRISYTWHDARKFGVDRSTAERINVWKKGFAYLQERPLLGHGIAARDVMDSQYVRTLIELGLIGFLIFLWIIFRIYKCTIILSKRAAEGWVKAISVGYLAGLTGILIHGFGAITFYIVRIMEPFWFFTGLIMFLYINYNKVDE